MLHPLGHAPVNSRLWYPQLDVCDCVRRIGAILLAYPHPPGLELLCIADFYLANPPLLHLSHMTRNTRSAFGALGIPRPQKAFLTYPAPALLFKKMEPIQSHAVRAMTGKGLLSVERSQGGSAELTKLGLVVFNTTLAKAVTAAEVPLIQFLTTAFATPHDPDSARLRRMTGLKRSFL